MGANLCGARLVLGGDGVASFLLRDVEGTVGAVDEGAQTILFPVPCGDAEAECNAVEALLKDASEMVTEGDHCIEVVVEGEEDELVAAVADEEVAAVDLLMDGVRDLPENLIAREMSFRIVDGLEVIYVKDGEREFEPALR